MLTSLTLRNNQKVIAADVWKDDGPFFCPECRGETVVHKGNIKIHHFAHKPPISCEYGKGESLEHMECKTEIYNELLKNQNLICELEKPLGKVRPDVYIKSNVSGRSYAIEVQISNLTMDKIIYRTRQYNSLGISVLWLSPYKDELDKKIYSPQAWEKWIHATYFGRVYYWLYGLTLQPIHFGEHRKYVDESSWYESGGYERSAGGYFKTQKRTKVISRGKPVDITKSFKPVNRDAWVGGDMLVPQCKILMDTQDVWWKNSEQPAKKEQPVWVTVNS